MNTASTSPKQGALPAIGFGTWPMDDAEAATAVAEALRIGYRLIDTAAIYGNETGVGRGLRESGVARGDVVLTSKLRGAEQGYDEALRGFDATTRRLGTDHVDLYLIHWPLPMKDRYVDSWRALIRLQQEGRVSMIGVSNFQQAHIERLQRETGVLPAVNQIELHPDFAQPALCSWLAAQGIAIEGWSPLGRGKPQGQVLETLAAKHGRTPAQVALRWHVQRGVVPIPKSSKPERMRENLDVFDFSLDAEDMAAIATLDGDHRQGGDPDTHVEE
ncbi:aldo/keto reductase [Luteimonas sp. BDR2-5]|uniref:aldo/keto reductase n=1 Tax=Proluteimonas luteida TaxID=2878685 RepID=UPI001E4E266B|nr:aldo/keto reductase [Luteimonas sp. BDR2-5]MCD9028378.1 aldo/keto reductase [Luteimonas sp. BDR2-5]